jgi:hypothetical protein
MIVMAESGSLTPFFQKCGKEFSLDMYVKKIRRYIIMKKLILFFLLLIFCLLYINIFAEQIVFTGDGKKVILKDDGTWEYLKDNSQKSYNTLPMGTTVKISNFKFCLNSARFSMDSDISSPKPNMVWLILDCTVTNLGNETETISTMLMFTLRDKEGYSQEQAIFAETKGKLDATISPGQTVRGEIAFEVEQGQAYWEFIFKADVFGTNQAIYSISKEQVK